MIHVSDKQMREIIQDHPVSNFIVFTHVDAKSPWHPDYLIRKALSIRYMHRGVTIHTTFSHCGSVWYDRVEDEIGYWHQTFPFFAKDVFSFRAYNVIYKIDDPEAVKFARGKCKNLYESKKPYGVGKLVAYIVTLWFTWLKNPIKAGKVCSEAVAASYPSLISTNPADTDPQLASFELDKAGLTKYIVDRT